MVISVEQLKKKWKNLKDAYRKEFKKISTTPRSGDPGSGDDNSSHWKYFNLMSFLKEDFMTVEGDSNLIENENEDLDVSSPSEAPSSPTPASPRPRDISPTRGSQSDTPLLTRKRSKANDIRAEYLEIEKKKLKILEEEIAKQNNQNTPDILKNDDYHYLMSILPEMQKLNSIQKLRLRNKINQALMDEMTTAMYGDPLSHRDCFTQPTSKGCNEN